MRFISYTIVARRVICATMVYTRNFQGYAQLFLRIGLFTQVASYASCGVDGLLSGSPRRRPAVPTPAACSTRAFQSGQS